MSVGDIRECEGASGPSIQVETGRAGDEDVRPAAVKGVRVESGLLQWDAAESADHRYYRVYKGGKQVASTVATSLKVKDASGDYSVRSVDKWLNVGE